MTFDRFLEVLRAYAIQLCAWTLAGLLAGIGAFFLLPKTYESEALIWVAAQGQEQTGVFPRDNIMATYLQYARSERVRVSAGEMLEADGYPADLADNVEIAVPENSSILVVTGSGSSPELARKITEVVTLAAAERLSADDPSGVESTVEIAQEPMIGNEPVSPSFLGVTIAGTIAGFVLGTVVSLVLSSRNPALYSIDSVAGRFGTRVIGSLGVPQSNRERRALERSGISNDPRNVFADLGISHIDGKLEVLAVAGIDRHADVAEVVEAFILSAASFGFKAQSMPNGIKGIDQSGNSMSDKSIRSALKAAGEEFDLIILPIEDVADSPSAPVMLSEATSAVYVFGFEPLMSSVDKARSRIRMSGLSIRGAVQATLVGAQKSSLKVKGEES